MNVLRVGFVGVRTDRVAETTAFFRDVVGLKPLGGTGDSHTISGLPERRGPPRAGLRDQEWHHR